MPSEESDPHITHRCSIFSMLRSDKAGLPAKLFITLFDLYSCSKM